MEHSIRWIDVDDQVVIYCKSRQTFVELDPSGAELWHVLANANWDRSSLTSYLCEVYSMDGRAATKIVDVFLADLAVLGV